MVNQALPQTASSGGRLRMRFSDLEAQKRRTPDESARNNNADSYNCQQFLHPGRKFCYRPFRKTTLTLTPRNFFTPRPRHPPAENTAHPRSRRSSGEQLNYPGTSCSRTTKLIPGKGVSTLLSTTHECEFGNKGSPQKPESPSGQRIS